MLEVSAYKLTDLLGSAGATIGTFIGGTIFLQFLSSKYVDTQGESNVPPHQETNVCRARR